MNILSITSNEFSAPTSTIIMVENPNRLPIRFNYNHSFGLLHDPNNPAAWVQWNGGSLVEAIEWVASLKEFKVN